MPLPSSIVFLPSLLGSWIAHDRQQFIPCSRFVLNHAAESTLFSPQTVVKLLHSPPLALAMGLIRTSPSMRSSSPTFDPSHTSFRDRFVAAFPSHVPSSLPHTGLSSLQHSSSLRDFQPVFCVSLHSSAAEAHPETVQTDRVVSPTVSPAVCSELPALEARVENLQRSKNGALKVGILEKVKRENGDEEDPYDTHSGKRTECALAELGEWSLKGVEERLRELEDDFQLRASTRPDCGEVHEGGFGVSVVNGKLSLWPRSLDEKSVVKLEDVPISESEGLHQRCLVLQSVIDADVNQSDAQPGNEALERLQQGNHSAQTSNYNMKHANTEVIDTDFKALVSVDNRAFNLLDTEGERPTEMQLHEQTLLISASTIRKHSASTFSKSIHKQKDAIGAAARWLRNRKANSGLSCRIRCTGCELGRHRKKHAVNTKPWMHHKTHFRSSSELEIQPMIAKKSKVNTILRSTNVILALPASFSEQDRSHLGKQYAQALKSISKPKLSQGCQCPVDGGYSLGRKVSCKEDSQQQSEISHNADGKDWHSSKQAKLVLEDHNDYDQHFCNGRVRLKSRLGLDHSQPLERCSESRLQTLESREYPVELENMTNCAAVEQHQGSGKQWHCFQQPKQGSFLKGGCFNKSNNNGHFKQGQEWQVKRCHRNDGKGWQCYREAKLGFTFCEHHLKGRRLQKVKERLIFSTKKYQCAQK